MDDIQPASQVAGASCLGARWGRSVLVLHAPRLDGLARILQRREPVVVETLDADVAVERLGVGVVGGLPWSRALQLHSMPVGPGVEGLRDEFGAVVNRDPLGTPTVRFSHSRTATTRSPVNEVPTSIAGLTRLTFSTNVKTRKRRPSARLSVRKSRLLRSCGRVAGGGSTRDVLTRFLRRLTRIPSPSSR